MKKLIITIIIASTLVTSIATPAITKLTPAYTSQTIIITKAYVQQILAILHAKNYTALTTYVHPTEGIRFAPYTYIDTVVHKVYSAKAFTSMVTNTKKYVWGLQDGSGDPIKLSASAYLNKYVYATNYVTNGVIALNKPATKVGNALNNIQQYYKGYQYASIYYKGTAAASNMDWRSLTLVTKAYKGKLYIVAIINNQWTI